MECPRCHQGNLTGQKFCAECGGPLQPFEGGGQAGPSYADLRRSLTEALEQQTATAEILRVISSSPTDVQPIFDAIVRSASRLCGGEYAIVTRYDGKLLHLAAQYNPRPGTAEETSRFFPQVPRRETSIVARALVDAAVVHVPDVETEQSEPSAREAHRRIRLRAVVAVPMVHEGRPIGVVSVSRGTPGPFSDSQVALLNTFADQAVIAIENVRLFTELQEKNRALMQAHAQVTEALEQQTATSEVLGVISSSPTDVQPVFDAVVENAVRLCSGNFGAVYRYDGERIHLAATHNISDEALEYLRRRAPRPPGSVVLERRIIQIADFETDPDVSEDMRIGARLRQSRSNVSVPLVRGEKCFGYIVIGKREPGHFADRQVELLKTFADQAVIAIENVRLFKELEARNRDLSATSEILQVISRSPTDEKPVFDRIVRSTIRLCDAKFCVAYRYDGEQLHVVAHDNLTPETLALLDARYPQPPSPDTATGVSTLERRIVHIPDASADDLPPASREFARQQGWGSLLAVPLLRDGQPLGSIAVARVERQPFTEQHIAIVQTFSDQAVIAIENVRLFTELHASNRELTTALDTQTATSDILRVISRSQTDVQPVFDAIVHSAVRLLHAYAGTLTRVEGDQLELGAFTSIDNAADAAVRVLYPLSLNSTGEPARAVWERAPINIADAPDDPGVPEAGRALARVRGYRSIVAVPLLRDDQALGSLVVTRREPGRFTDDEVALLQTFADQAVIAIENARLLTELQQRNEALTHAHAQVTESLEQQTATSEILRVISRSPVDIQPVLDAVAMNAAVVCGATDALIMRVEGPNMRRVAHFGVIPLVMPPVRPVTEQSSVGRVILECRPIHLDDIQDPEVMREFADNPTASGAAWRTSLTVPLVRDGKAIGAIAIRRTEVRPFTEKQITLLQTFADQAVIAIENVRLFTELQASNRELATALDTQTATSEILRVISGSRTDVQPVFEAILASAVRLFRAYTGLVTQIVGDQIVLAAFLISDGEGEADAALRTFFPRPLDSEGPHPRAIRDRAPINVADAPTDPRLSEVGQSHARLRGYRSLIVVPLLRQDAPIGTIVVTRRAPGGFTDDEIALLQTFADQAVIAIENARLLSELQARTEDLTRSVGELRALSEIGRAIGSTLDLDTVLATIVARATELGGADAGVIYEYDEQREIFERRATERLEAEIAQALVATPIRRGQGVTGQLERVRAPIQQAEISTPGEQLPVRDALLRAGYRSLLAVPLLHEDHLIGGLTVFRKRPGEFAASVVELLQTFATQSALAIQNARLFREIEIKSRELEAASQHKSEFLANMSHELRTPLNAIIGFSEVLSERMFGDLNEKQDEYLKDIHASGQHLLSLINDILDLSKIEAGRMELELADFHLPQAIDNALVLVRERALRRGITLEQSIDPRLGEMQGDERKIKQVLLNLLANAIKFTPEGGRVEVRAAVANNMAELSVTDTGVGIAPEDHEAVFEEFRQVGTAEKKAEGTGLGLALARRFIELHGGRIWVKSQLGAGSTFTFTLPVRRGE